MKGNNAKPVYIIAGGMLSVLLIYGIYKLLTNKDEPNPFKAITKKPSGFCQHSGFPLKYGSCGEKVKALQRYLNSKTRPPRILLKVDGKMGNKTIAALKRIEGISTVSQSKFEQLNIQLNPFTQGRI